MALIEYNDPILLMQAIERVKSPAKFLVDTFFPQRMPVLNGDKIMVEMRSGHRRLAPYVVRGGRGVNMDRDASSFKFYRPPMVGPRRTIDQEDLRHREFGETVYSQMTEAQRAAHIMGRDLSYLKDTILNRKNKMAAEILTTGKCEIKGYADDGVTALEETIDFGWGQKVVPAVHWDNPAATIYDDIMGAIWWMPDIDDQVLCVLLPNASGKGPGEGFVVGAMYSEADPPAESDNNVRSIRYKDGSYIVNDSGAIEIHASKSLKLTAPRIDVN